MREQLICALCARHADVKIWCMAIPTYYTYIVDTMYAVHVSSVNCKVLNSQMRHFQGQIFSSASQQHCQICHFLSLLSFSYLLEWATGYWQHQSRLGYLSLPIGTNHNTRRYTKDYATHKYIQWEFPPHSSMILFQDLDPILEPGFQSWILVRIPVIRVGKSKYIYM